MQTDIQATLNVMKTDLLATLETMRAENAKRETRLILTLVGLLIAATSILGFLLATLN